MEGKRLCREFYKKDKKFVPRKKTGKIGIVWLDVALIIGLVKRFTSSGPINLTSINYSRQILIETY